MTEKTDQATATEEQSSRTEKGSDAKPTTVDVVKKVRETRAAEESARTAKSKPAAASKDDAGGEAKGGDGKDGNQKEAQSNAPEMYTAEELAALPSLVNADMKRVPTELRNTVAKMQAAERKRIEKYDAAIADVRKGKPEPEKKTATNDGPREGLFTKEELADIFGSTEGKAFLEEYVKDKFGDPDEVKELSEDRVMNKALNGAAEKYPELAKDQSFFQDCVRAIADDDELTEDFNKNLRNPRTLSRIFKEAAADVRSQRAASEQAKTSKERERLEKDKENVKRAKEADNAKPGSAAAKSGRKAGVNAEGPMATKDVIKMIRAQRGYDA